MACSGQQHQREKHLRASLAGEVNAVVLQWAITAARPAALLSLPHVFATMLFQPTTHAEAAP